MPRRDRAPRPARSEALLVAGLEPEHKEMVTGQQLIKRFGQMEDQVGMVLFLCSAEASFITRQTYLVDGGFLPRD